MRSPDEIDAGTFAIVMATGIVSVAGSLLGFPVLSDALLALACVAWLALAVAIAPRVLRAPRPRPCLRSFAVVAATAVLGARFALSDVWDLAGAFWGLACLLWLVLVLRRPGVPHLGGGSLLVVVGTESLAVLAAVLARRLTPGLATVSLAAWALGLALYPFVAGAIASMLHRRPLFAPELWILMGALAIATLAGAELLASARALHVLGGGGGWLPEAALATWAAASAFVPLLVAAELHHHRFGYEPGRWSFVFPLGMYSVATWDLARAESLPALGDVALAFFAAALAAWTVTALGLALRRPG